MKECTKCHLVKADTDFYKGRGDCKACKVNLSRTTYAPRKQEVKERRLKGYKGDLKICRTCKEAKPVTEYRAHLEHWDKLEHDCITCKLQLGKESYYRKWEEISTKRKETLKRKRAAGVKNQYKWMNVAGRKANWHRRKARKLQIGGSFTKVQWGALIDYYSPDGKCISCGELKPLTADHVIPIAKGGTSNIGNIQPICQICNSRKNISSTDYRFDKGEFAKSLEILGEK